MAALRHVCISDLHLGAGYSLLTGVDGAGRVTPGERCETLLAMLDALAPTLAPLCDDEPPTLVLLGDVLDMGQSPLGLVSEAFRTFVRELARPRGARALFAPRVRVVPGNHDHHLWRMVQDQSYLRQAAAGQVPADVPYDTPLTEAPGRTWPPCDLLNALARAEPQTSHLSFEVAYPNFAFVDAARQRAVVLHHGHYVDSMYRVMSTLAAHEAPRPPDTPPPPLTAAQIEAQNGAWVDFLWSDLGSAGAVGRESVQLYEVLRDAGASQRWTRHLARRITSQLSNTLGVAGTMPVFKGVTVQQAVSGLLDVTLGQAAEAQRSDYLQLATANDVAHLRWYLSGAVAQQLQHEGFDPHDFERLELSFIYGHTHKPYQSELPVPGLGRPVAVYNTGGWVMDQPTMTRTQGAALVLIDSELNLASLRLFNDPLNGECPAVHAAGTGTARDEGNPLLSALAQAVAKQEGEWGRFTRSAVSAAQRHARELLDEFFDHASGNGPSQGPTHSPNHAPSPGPTHGPTDHATDPLRASARPATAVALNGSAA